jgi:hypothetical protein
MSHVEAMRHQRRARITIASTVQPEPLRWLWPGYLPLGKATLLAGDAGLGKSTMSCDLAARVSRGLAMPDGTHGSAPAGVVMIGTEDGRADTVRPRLDAAGADCDRIAFVTVELPDGWEDALTLPDDLPMVREAIERVGAALVVVDPVVAFIGLATDTHSDHQVRRAIGPLSVLAEKMGVAALGLSHPSRSRGGGNPLHFSGGSLGFVNASRSALIVAPDPDDAEHTVLASSKCNVGPKPASLTYRIVGADNGASRIDWLGASPHTAEGLLAQPANDEDRSAVDEAVEFLRERLADGPVEAATVKAEARRAGVAEKTLWRAAKRLGVKTNDRAGFGRGHPSRWTLRAPTGPKNAYSAIPEVWPSRANDGRVGNSAEPADLPENGRISFSDEDGRRARKILESNPFADPNHWPGRPGLQAALVALKQSGAA